MAVTDAEARALKAVRDILKDYGVTTLGLVGAKRIVAAVVHEVCPPRRPDRPAPEGDGPDGVAGTD